MKYLSMKKFLWLFIFLAGAFCMSGQKQEMGLLGGVSSYKGELNPVLLDSRFFSPAAGVFYRYNVNRFFSAKTSVYYGKIKGDDNLSDKDFNKNRNLNFYSELLDVSVTSEFNFFPYEIGSSKFPFTTYIFSGIGLFKFNPKTEYQGLVEELQPLGTEGQGTTGYPDHHVYALTQFCIPMGIGMKLNLGKFMAVGFEFGARYTFTDYIDDVSGTYVDKRVLSSENGPVSAALSDRSLSKDAKIGGLRGNPDNNDWYFFSGLTLFFRLDKRPNSCDPFYYRHQENYND